MPRAGSEDTTNKALLLLRRERELYDLRQLRSRTEEWLKALHLVWPENARATLDVVAGRAIDLLVGDLGFEAAGILEYDSTKASVGFTRFEPRAVTMLELPRPTAEFLDTNRTGLVDGPNHPLSELGRACELEKFYWSWSSSCRDTRFLLVAGCSARSAQFHSLSTTDLEHFAMFSSHAAALISNGILLDDLERERQEIRSANRELDASLRRLNETQQKVVESTRLMVRASRSAGMAEVATGILHNVGNVLNSVNVCAEVAQERARELRVDGLLRVVGLMNNQEEAAELFRTSRGTKVVEYLRQLARSVENSRDEIGSEIGQLQRHLAHVAGIVSRQQEYARSGVAERCSPVELMEDALLLARSANQRGEVRVVRAFEAVPDLLVDKHRVLQILVNLMSNALAALGEANVSERILTAGVARIADEGVRFEVGDNGVGIKKEHESQLFRHGFTTRRDGHGFGLHTSALTAKEIGGELGFESAGPGLGAIFRLDVPLQPPSKSESEAGA